VVRRQVIPLDDPFFTKVLGGEWSRCVAPWLIFRYAAQCRRIRLVVLGILGSGAQKLGIGNLAIESVSGRLIEWRYAAFSDIKCFASTVLSS
jgi:hypothetical protein